MTKLTKLTTFTSDRIKYHIETVLRYCDLFQNHLNPTSNLCGFKKDLTSVLQLVKKNLTKDKEIKAKFGYYFSAKHLQEDYLVQIAIENYENSFLKCNYNFVFKRTKQLIKQETDIVKSLRKIKFPPQRSPGWYIQRKSGLTASNIVKVINGSQNDKRKIILDKCGHEEPFYTNAACQHGIKHEDVAIQIYEKRHKKKFMSLDV